MESDELNKLEHQGGQKKIIQGKQSWMCCSLLSWKALRCFKNQGAFCKHGVTKALSD